MQHRGVKRLGLVVLVALSAAACATARAPREEPQTVMFSPPESAEDPPELPESRDVLAEEEDGVAAVPSPPDGSVSQGGELVVKRADVVAGLKRGPGWALGQVNVKPSRDGAGDFVGFEVDGFSPEAGPVVSPPLMRGDVITHLMGVRLKSPDDYMSAWQLVNGADALRIDYVRDGATLFSVWRVED
jgi:hypothetical protein